MHRYPCEHLPRPGALACVLAILSRGAAAGEPCDGAVLLYGFSAGSVVSQVAHQGIVGGRSAAGEILVRVPEGRVARASVHANLVLQASVHGALGWGMSVAIEGAARAAGATTAGTAADTRGGGFFTAGFQKTEVVLPERNGGKLGVISIFLSGSDPVEALPRHGTYSVLRIDLEATAPQGQADSLAKVRFLDGLVGSGQPVPNTAGVDGGAEPPCNLDTALLTVRFQAGAGNLFVRGNANGDGVVNIADAIWTFRALFLSAVAGPCTDAEDANGDGRVNITDPLHLLNFQLLGGAPPPAPFPGCGEDPGGDGDGIGCAITQAGCAG
jgi:hypothetical protein